MGTDAETERALVREVAHLRGELSLANKGLANATQEIEQSERRCTELGAELERAIDEIDRLVLRCAMMGALLYPRELREAVAGDIGWPE